MHIRSYKHPDDEAELIALWKKCGLVKPWNDPTKDIERKLTVNPELFLVGLIDNKMAATAMGGYEGHRGWVNYLAVDPDYQRRGLGGEIMQVIEAMLLERGCPKINLQIRTSNLQAIRFYESIGYKEDEVVSLGKRLIPDD